MKSSPESCRRSWMPSANSLVGAALLWMRLAILVAFVVLVGALLTGCGRTVLVSEGSPVRLGPGTKAKIYFLDPITGEWTLSDNCVELDEGWYLVPPSFVEEGK